MGWDGPSNLCLSNVYELGEFFNSTVALFWGWHLTSIGFTCTFKLAKTHSNASFTPLFFAQTTRKCVQTHYRTQQKDLGILTIL